MRRVKSIGIDGRTDYAADAGDILREATRVGTPATHADMMDRAPRDLYE